MRLYFIETEEWPGEWLTHTNTGERTLGEARERREVFMSTYEMYQPKAVRIGKYECRRIEKKRKAKAVRR